MGSDIFRDSLGKRKNNLSFRLDDNIFGTKKASKSKKTSTKCPPHLKKAIRQRWWGDSLRGSCFCCGRKDLHYDDADAGHIKANSKGGKWSPNNARLVCRNCNTGMGNTNMKVYMRRYYPERYDKYFKDDKSRTSKKKTKTTKKIKSRSPFDFGSPF